MRELRLSELWIYPVKSLGGIKLESSRVSEKGLTYDRRWMLVDPLGVFMNQRTTPSMALFKPSLTDGVITIHYKDDKITLPHSFSADAQRVTIWGDTVSAFEVSKEHSQWFADLLGKECRLVYFPEDNPRPLDRDFFTNDENVSLADAYPFLIIGQRSLDDLNLRLAQPVPMNRFRPNFVFTGGEPYEEDTWRDFSIGQNRFAGIKPCARCVLTTVNQDTGIKGSEPLKTLSTYRNRNNKVLFGQNVISIDQNEVRVGDAITVSSYQTEPAK